LFYDQWRFDDSGISDEAGLQLYRHNGQRWELVGGTADPQKNSVAATGVTEFSKWTFANPNDQPLEVEETSSPNPEEFVLWQNYPNPFNASTIIQYRLPEARHVMIKVYNLLGQEVQTLVDAVKQAGMHKTVWDGKNHLGQVSGSGLYIVRLISGDVSKSTKVILLK
ncbi:MAG: T9SS type A sorting domain-containing protein, partial [bacterium]